MRRPPLRRPTAPGQNQAEAQGSCLWRNATCHSVSTPPASALAVDLTDVRRLERILVQVLKLEAALQLPMRGSLGRFARLGSLFAYTASQRARSA